MNRIRFKPYVSHHELNIKADNGKEATIHVVRNSIIDENVDVIVNPSN